MSELPRNFYDLAHQLADMEVDVVSAEVSKITESPIEMALATAILILGHRSYGAVAYMARSDDDYEFPERALWILAMQRQIGSYRVDFVLSANPYRKSCQVVIECDGHEFHERTKEQAARDRSRDRYLQAEGYRVFRFTGSEIHRDAFACANEVFKTLVRMKSDEETK